MHQDEEKRPPSLREKLKEAAMGQILDAAEAVFIQKGFEGTTMLDIASTVGCAAGTLYLHFKSKDSLFQAIIARRSEVMFASGSAAMSQGTDPLDKLRRGMQAIFHFIDVHREFFRLFLDTNQYRVKGMRKNISPEITAVRDRYEAEEIICLQEAQQKGLIRRDISPQIIKSSLDAIAITLVDEYVQPGSNQSSDELMRIVWGLFWGGVRGEQSEPTDRTIQ